MDSTMQCSVEATTSVCGAAKTAAFLYLSAPQCGLLRVDAAGGEWIAPSLVSTRERHSTSKVYATLDAMNTSGSDYSRKMDEELVQFVLEYAPDRTKNGSAMSTAEYERELHRLIAMPGPLEQERRAEPAPKTLVKAASSSKNLRELRRVQEKLARQENATDTADASTTSVGIPVSAGSVRVMSKGMELAFDCIVGWQMSPKLCNQLALAHAQLTGCPGTADCLVYSHAAFEPFRIAANTRRCVSINRIPYPDYDGTTLYDAPLSAASGGGVCVTIRGYEYCSLTVCLFMQYLVEHHTCFSQLRMYGKRYSKTESRQQYLMMFLLGKLSHNPRLAYMELRHLNVTQSHVQLNATRVNLVDVYSSVKGCVITVGDRVRSLRVETSEGVRAFKSQRAIRLLRRPGGDGGGRTARATAPGSAEESNGPLYDVALVYKRHASSDTCWTAAFCCCKDLSTPLYWLCPDPQTLRRLTLDVPMCVPVSRWRCIGHQMLAAFVERCRGLERVFVRYDFEFLEEALSKLPLLLHVAVGEIEMRRNCKRASENILEHERATWARQSPLIHPTPSSPGGLIGLTSALHEAANGRSECHQPVQSGQCLYPGGRRGFHAVRCLEVLAPDKGSILVTDDERQDRYGLPPLLRKWLRALRDFTCNRHGTLPRVPCRSGARVTRVQFRSQCKETPGLLPLVMRLRLEFERCCCDARPREPSAACSCSRVIIVRELDVWVCKRQWSTCDILECAAVLLDSTPEVTRREVEVIDCVIAIATEQDAEALARLVAACGSLSAGATGQHIHWNNQLPASATCAVLRAATNNPRLRRLVARLDALQLLAAHREYAELVRQAPALRFLCLTAEPGVGPPIPSGPGVLSEVHVNWEDPQFEPADLLRNAARFSEAADLIVHRAPLEARQASLVALAAGQLDDPDFGTLLLSRCDWSAARAAECSEDFKKRLRQQFWILWRTQGLDSCACWRST